MNELITSSLIWRFFVRMAAWLRGTWLGRAIRGLGRLWRASAIYGFFARLLCAPDPAEGSRFRGSLDRLNLWLHLKGSAVRRLIEESGSYRLYRKIFAYCSESRLAGNEKSNVIVNR